MSERWIYRFGPFELDPSAGQLVRELAPCPLAPQPMRLLELLVSRAGLLVTRDEVRAHLWGDRAVEHDQGLNFSIRRIRSALGERAAEARYIETVAGRGYRFAAPVERIARADRDDVAAAPERGARRRWRLALALAFALALGLSGGWLVSQASAPLEIEVWVRPALADVGVAAGADVAGALTERLRRRLAALEGVAVRVVPPAPGVEPGASHRLALVLETRLSRRSDQVVVATRLAKAGELEPFWTSDIAAPPEALAVVDREIASDLGSALSRLRDGTLPDYEVITRAR